jgi:hypothetical protein
MVELVDAPDLKSGGLTAVRVRLPLGAQGKSMAQHPYMYRGKNYIRFTCDICGVQIAFCKNDYHKIDFIKKSMVKTFDSLQLCQKCDEKTEDEKRKFISMIAQAKAQEGLYRKRKFGGY